MVVVGTDGISFSIMNCHCNFSAAHQDSCWFVPPSLARGSSPATNKAVITIIPSYYGKMKDARLVVVVGSSGRILLRELGPMQFHLDNTN